MTTRFLFASLIVILATACQSNQAPNKSSTVQKSMDEALLEHKKTQQNLGALPEAVSDALSPSESRGNEPLFADPSYDINANGVDAASFFSGIVKDTPYSVAMHPEVAGKITLDLKQVTMSQVFEIVTELYGFDIQQKNNIFTIYPAGMRTETFSVNYLLMQRSGVTQTSITSGGVSQAAGQNGNSSGSSGNSQGFGGNSSSQLGGSGSTGGLGGSVNGTNISSSTETDFWKELEETVSTLIGTADGRNVVVTPQAGLVTVRALPAELKSVKDFLRVSEETIQRQVVLEARIIEVTLTDEYQQGVNWTQVLSSAGDTDFRFSTSAGTFGNEVTASLGNVTGLSFVNQDFSGVLSLLSTQGNVQVLSSPRVTALNNQKAVLKAGDDEYFVTDVSSQSTISSSTTSVVPNIELTPFFSGIALDVTPQIDDEGNVLLHVHPSVIETQEQEKIVTLNQEQFVLPLAQSNIRESDTMVYAKSGEIVVIGGLMQSITSETESKTPLLGDVPFLGNLFKHKQDTEVKKELVILIKPVVVGANTWKEQIKQSRDKMVDWLYVE